MFTCPRCHEDTIGLKDKYRASLWRAIYCPKCGAKLTAYPWVLLIMNVLYVWNVLWWFSLYHFEGDPLNFLYMAIGWLVLDVLSVNLVPLAVMRSRPS